MNELVKMLLIVCPLVFLGGFVDSVAGGGGLITLPAYMMAGVPVHFAAGTNKVVNGCGSATASVKFFRSGKIRICAALCAALGALAGGYAGAEIAKQLSEGLLKGLMLVALPVVAVFLVVRKDFGQETGEEQYPRSREMGVSLGIGLVIGCYDGMIGPGTGTFMIMAFTALLRMDMVTASGCSKVGNLASNIAAAASYALGGKVMWMLVVPAALCSMLGNWCGARYAIRGGGKKIRGMIFVVLGMLFAKLLVDLLA
ncbi:MAG: sulfite exporter TauE/SafE family protein [Oscillospiraceae bacterium]|nr:sulfite exporter TauE/SafE family protein [Oscillospiraceae bacterium]